MSPTAPDPTTSEATEAASAAPSPALVSLARLLGRAAAREWLRQQPGAAPTGEPETGTPGRRETGW